MLTLEAVIKCYLLHDFFILRISEGVGTVGMKELMGNTVKGIVM